MTRDVPLDLGIEWEDWEGKEVIALLLIGGDLVISLLSPIAMAVIVSWNFSLIYQSIIVISTVVISVVFCAWKFEVWKLILGVRE